MLCCLIVMQIAMFITACRPHRPRTSTLHLLAADAVTLGGSQMALKATWLELPLQIAHRPPKLTATTGLKVATLAGSKHWFPLMRRSAADAARGSIRLSFSWDVTARSLLNLKLATLERVLAQRSEVPLLPVTPTLVWVNCQIWPVF